MGRCTSRFTGVGNTKDEAIQDLFNDMKVGKCTNIVMENNDILFTYKGIRYRTDIVYYYEGNLVSVCIY